MPDKDQTKMKLGIPRTIDTSINHHTKDITKGNTLFNIFFIKHETQVLKLGFSFTETSPKSISELEADIYNFIRKLHLIHHFHYSTYKEKVVKNAWTFTPKTNENQELETIGKSLSKTKININWTSNNIPNFTDGLNSLMTKIRSNKVINQPQDKGSTEKLLSCTSYEVVVVVVE